MPGRLDRPQPYDEDWDVQGADESEDAGLPDDEDETPTVPCPNCRREIPDFADRCPYCGDWVVQSAGGASRRNIWFVLLVVAVLAAFVLFYVL